MAVLGLQCYSGFYLVAVSGGYFPVVVCGFFLAVASIVVERRLSRSGTWAQLLLGMWDLPRPGTKPMSPALAGRFLTTEPPGKP